jgi:hypothetical protein
MIIEERPATAEDLAMIPTCAVCGRRVERFGSHRDLLRGATVFTAWCHGEVEETVIFDNEMVSFGPLRITGAMAFAKKVLPHPASCST